MLDPILKCATYPVMFMLYGAVTSCTKAMSMSCFLTKSVSIPTRVWVFMLLKLRQTILAINFLYVGGVSVRQCSALCFPFVCRPAGQAAGPLLYLFPNSN